MVYVDDYRGRLGRMVMCHMIADTPEELHDMARRIGMKRSWFQSGSFPHYDVSRTRRAMAVKLGAREVSSKQLVAIIRKLRQRTESSEDIGSRRTRSDRSSSG